jgi:tetratricopeptide (TPR) repeat protein
MHSSFPQSALTGLVFAATVLVSPAVLAQQKPEASHRERFAPRAEITQKAEQDLDAKLAAHPDDPHLLSDRGLLRLEAKQTVEAIADLRKAVDLAPGDAQVLVNLAYGLALTGNNSDAADEARKALNLDADNASAHAVLGRVLIGSAGSTKEGIEHLQRSLEIFPDQPNLRFDLVNALRQTQDYVAAGIQLRILKDSLPPGNARLEYTQGLIFADLGRPEAAAASFRRALASDPDLLPARQDLGAALVRSGKWNEAAALLAEVAKAQPDSFSVAYLYALALQNSGDLATAEVEARHAISLNQDSADAHTLLGITLSSQSRFAEAIDELDRAVVLQPGSFDAQLYLGRARYGLSDASGAAQALQQAVKIRPTDPEARFLLGTVLEIAGDKDGAIMQYHELQDISPRDPRGYLGMGSILSKYGQNDEAIQQLEHARSLDPKNFEANMALGRVLAKTGKFAESIPWLEQASRERPESPEVHYQLALSLQRAGQQDRAAREFAEVDRLNQQRRSATPPEEERHP